MLPQSHVGRQHPSFPSLGWNSGGTESRCSVGFLKAGSSIGDVKPPPHITFKKLAPSEAESGTPRGFSTSTCDVSSPAGGSTQ